MKIDKIDKKLKDALDLAFNSEKIRALTPENYVSYVQLLLTISLTTVKRNKGVQFTKDFIEAGLNTNCDDLVCLQVKEH